MTTQQTWLGNLWANIETAAEADYEAALAKLSELAHAAKSVVTHEVWPFLANLFKIVAMDTVKAIEPYAEEAVEEIAADLPLLFSQGVEGFLKAFNAVVASTFQKVQGAALTVGEHDVIVAAQAALANAKAKIASAGQ